MLARRKHWFLRGFAGLLALFSVALGGGAYYAIDRMREQAVASQLELAATHARGFENHLTESLTLVSFTLSQQFVDPVSASSEQRLRAALLHAPVLRSLSMIDQAGTITLSSNPYNVGTEVDTEEFLPPLHPAGGQLRIGAPWEGRDFGSGRPSNPADPVAKGFRAFIPVVWTPFEKEGNGVEGRPAAALAALNPDWLITLLENNIPLEKGVVDVLRFDGTLLFSTDPEERFGERHTFPKGLDLAKEEFGAMEMEHAGAPTLSAFRASLHHPLVVLVHLNRGAALAGWRSEAELIGWSVGLSLLALVLLGSLSMFRILRSLGREEEAEQRVRLSAKVFESAEEGILITDAERRILSVNPGFERITGYTRADVLGRNPSMLSSGKHEQSFYQAMWQEIGESNGWSGEIVNRRKDGSLVTEWLRISRVLGPDGEVQHYIGVFADISVRKAAEADLRKLSLAVEQSPSSVVITDLEGTIEYVNRTFTEVTGYTREEAVGANPRFLKSGKTPRDVYPLLWGTIKAGHTWEGEFINRRKDGTLFFEHALISPVMAEGRMTHYVAVKHDITALREGERALIAAKEAAEAANRAKSAFLANMSHELRTPLNAILGHAQILVHAANLTGAQREGLGSICRNGDHLVTLINDVLDLARAEADRLALLPEAADLNVAFS